MNIQPTSSSASPSTWSEIYQVPGQTSRDILLRARELYLINDIQQFRDLLNSAESSSENFHINDFSIIMKQAVEQDNMDFMQALMDHGFPTHSIYAQSTTRYRSKNTLAFLIEKGLDINKPICETQPPILGYIHHGADPNKHTSIDNIQPGQLLHHAVQRDADTIEVLEILIQKGAPLNTPVHKDLPTFSVLCFISLGTPLHRASELRRVDVVHYLLSKGADQNVRDSRGLTAIQLAARLNQQAVVEVLQRRESGGTPFTTPNCTPWINSLHIIR
ncbi:ankyrin repeat domain-containing protein [Aspergillus neoniger CBS 115656]|uniref:Ankyrin n=1 Tax=Aspergillus neoniger (strain CBS 115656) TaxID=1448310 RepID=A0A318YLP0_ASPNB|nr:ankyrin [Aspergillus neoniger CBS 115656]PYH35279.1 ankyrin [Aspergillus neoniger CBS 115656]